MRLPAPGARRLLLLPLLGALLGAATPAPAADEEPIDLEALQEQRAARGKAFTTGSRIARYIDAAAKALDDEKPEEARALLDKLNPKRLNPEERALWYRMRGYVAYYSADYAAAVESFEAAIGEEVLPIRDDNRMRLSIAQLHASQQKWKEAIAALDVWFRYERDPDPLGYYLRGIAHYQLGETKQAIADTEAAVDASLEPPEGWLQLLAALYVQQEDFAKATPVLEELVLRFPKKQYWVQLSLIYGARDDYRHSLAVQQVAYAQGLLSENEELRRLARSYLFHDLPYPAARVLEKGIADGAIEPDAAAYELLANSWIAAREYERSVPALLEAAQRSGDGNLYARLGQVYLQREEWTKAADTLQHALAKGGLKEPGNAQLLLGIAYYNDKRLPQARSSFARALEHAATREAAGRWMMHLEQEATGGDGSA